VSDHPVADDDNRLAVGAGIRSGVVCVCHFINHPETAASASSPLARV
jgi:hypothetical protein